MEKDPKKELEEMFEKHPHLELVFKKIDNYMRRYIEAENKIGELITMPFYKRLFFKKDLIEFLESRKKFNEN